MIYLLIGRDHRAKNAQIEAIKQDILTTPQARQFDCDVLYAKRLNPDTLRKTLLSLPAIGSVRVIVLYDTQKLDEHNRRVILELIESSQEHFLLILEAEEMDARSVFYKKLTSYAQVFRFEEKKKKNIFDVTRMMASGQTDAALKGLHELMEQGAHPLQLMGGITWFWGKQRASLSSDRFYKGLRYLQEADINIKRNRINPQQAMDVLIVKLMAEEKSVPNKYL